MLAKLSCDLRYALVVCCITRMLSDVLLSELRAVSNSEFSILWCWRFEAINSETYGPQPILYGSRDYVLGTDVR